MNKDDAIIVLGGTGLVGSSLCRILKEQGYNNIFSPKRNVVNLMKQGELKSYLDKISGDRYIVNAAGTVGGVKANSTYPAQFIYNNITMSSNAIHESYLSNVKIYVGLGSSCIYPNTFENSTIKETDFLSGKLELTNRPYALAKIAAIEMANSYWKEYKFKTINVMPSNLYGSSDHYDLENSHVLPALIAKMHKAKINKDINLTLWGNGKSLREFTFVDDLSYAIIALLEKGQPIELVNIGSGFDISIKELAEIIKKVVGYNGELEWNGQLSGTYKKLMDMSLLKSILPNWKPKTDLLTGVEIAYKDYLERFCS